MKAARLVLEYLRKNNITQLFGIPAGSVNALFDELYDMPQMTPVIAKHEGAASYMAAAYAKYTNGPSVAIGCSGPGSTNLVTGAANAMREHLPVLFITGAVPVNTEGWNASQELDAEPLFRPVTKFSATVREAEGVLPTVAKALETALSGVPGPVHIAIPIDVQHAEAGNPDIPELPERVSIIPDEEQVREAAEAFVEKESGYILAGQGIRGHVGKVMELAELLGWPVITTPQAKGYMPDDHPLTAGIYGFAGHELPSDMISGNDGKCLLILGSSLGETATNNYNDHLAKDRFTVQLDFDQTVFDRKYRIDLPILGDMGLSLSSLIEQLRKLGREPGKVCPSSFQKRTYTETEDYNTQNTLLMLQTILPPDTRYTVDIGEFMSYVIHYMRVLTPGSFDINVHFGAMGSGIGHAIGSKLAEPNRPVACITGDGCFFMHGMEVLTAKEYNLPILFVVMNNARLGMVYHGHSLQFGRTHPALNQAEVNIAGMAAAMNIPSRRVESLADLNQDMMDSLLEGEGPAILEIALVDNNTPPMGDRVKFLSSFGK